MRSDNSLHFEKQNNATSEYESLTQYYENSDDIVDQIWDLLDDYQETPYRRNDVLKNIGILLNKLLVIPSSLDIKYFAIQIIRVIINCRFSSYPDILSQLNDVDTSYFFGEYCYSYNIISWRFKDAVAQDIWVHGVKEHRLECLNNVVNDLTLVYENSINNNFKGFASGTFSNMLAEFKNIIKLIS